MDLIASQSLCKVLTSQLSEVRSKLSEASAKLQASLHQEVGVMPLLLQADMLTSDDQKLLAYYLLTAKAPDWPTPAERPNPSPSPTCLLLSCTSVEEASSILSALLSHLSPRDRVAVLSQLVPMATGDSAAELPAALVALLRKSCDLEEGSATATAGSKGR